MINKTVISTLVFFLTFSAAFSQSVKTKTETSRINGETMDGYAVTLDGTFTDVNPAFFKYLKSLTIGKAKQSAGTITITDPVVNGITYYTPIYGTAKDNTNTTTVWLGIKTSDWQEADATKANKLIEKTIYDFGVKFYRDKIQLQIDESTRASTAVDKQQQRILNENQSLNSKLEYNKREKLRLEKLLADNKTEYELLLKKIEQNLKAQDSIKVVSGQVKKVVEMHKDRQNKVN